ncbi:alanine/glycine:cation symporter family protein [Lawsonella clevelandensis]|uniref:alanine/glycine:cation symporter family protein n=1 Tax=Lawsonella clevelandensis TaxID=1528099 RepID=UPI0023F1B227|nr:alanine/glycine:cation symporter family protein [Lawsonella clevelandensis]
MLPSSSVAFFMGNSLAVKRALNGSVFSVLTDLVAQVEGFISSHILIFVLVGLGVAFTVATKAVQFRLFGHMWHLMLDSRKQKGTSLSSFQAFTVGLASRVGTGNIAGVSLALIIGGPGALFWMWMVALLGMATSFMESTLAQIFKIKGEDGLSRGGPAYYIERGLGSRVWGCIFAGLLVFSYGLIFPMVQSNTIAQQFKSTAGVPKWVTALILVAISIPIMLGGLRRVAKVTERLVPIMAIAYLVVALVIIVMNITELPRVLSDIFAGAFGLRPGLAGIGGGLWATIFNGAKRGLFSNEAGQGSMPNGAATADVPHPVVQGLIQALGTFVDTIIVCSMTGFMILLAGPSVYVPGQKLEDDILAQAALTHHLDYGTGWTIWFMSIVIFFFAYSSTLGYSVFAEINVNYLGWKKHGSTILHVLMIAATGLGAIAALPLAWSLADLALALMTIINMVAVALLMRYVVRCLRDYDAQRKAGSTEPVFVETPGFFPKPVPDSVWVPVKNSPAETDKPAATDS